MVKDLTQIAPRYLHVESPESLLSTEGARTRLIGATRIQNQFELAAVMVTALPKFGVDSATWRSRAGSNRGRCSPRSPLGPAAFADVPSWLAGTGPLRRPQKSLLPWGPRRGPDHFAEVPNRPNGTRPLRRPQRSLLPRGPQCGRGTFPVNRSMCASGRELPFPTLDKSI